MRHEIGFARRCFAARVALVDELAARDEGFRDLCCDFATADELRQAWETSTEPERDERHAECVELVESLRAEIEAALDNASVVRFPRPRH
ncbi:hypothetical protein [Pararhizobium sp. A13]|uniref:hypothetical protein n=1 Tax=Pararhizobium sp. A13 TaxID=3133975 RepID=UPI00324CA513